MISLLKECHGARSGQGTRASARRKRFHPLTAPARHDRAMLVGTKGVPTVSTTPPAGRTKGCQKNLPNDPGLENGGNGRSSRLRNLTVATPMIRPQVRIGVAGGASGIRTFGP